MQQAESEKLYPFEGSGIDTVWQLTIPKSSNFFDFSTIADIILEIEYTSLEDFTYKQQVLKNLSHEIEFDRTFSFKNNFADQWYDLNHPTEDSSPISTIHSTINIYRSDFPSNIIDNSLAVENVILYFAKTRVKKKEAILLKILLHLMQNCLIMNLPVEEVCQF